MMARPKPSLIVMMIAGAAMFLFSFMPFYSVDEGFERLSVNAWEKGLFPLASVVALFGAAVALLAAIRAFGNVKPPDKVLTLDTKQQGFLLSFTSVIIMLGFLVLDGPEKGAGFWLSIIASVALLGGTIMDMVETESPLAIYGQPGQYPPGPMGPPGPPSYPPGPPPPQGDSTRPPGF